MQKKSSSKQTIREGETNVSPAVVHRLPRYYRYLWELMREGVSRVSSGELSERMHVTASQIRQDLNCFGGFGQQGYGYNVNYLFTKIGELLGVGAGYCAIVVGAGHLGCALVGSPMFDNRGVNIVAMFDVNPRIVGKQIHDTPVLAADTMKAYCREHRVDFAVLTVPKQNAHEVAATLADAGIRAIWNFTGAEIDAAVPGLIVENVHLGDSLMVLNYALHEQEGKDGQGI